MAVVGKIVCLQEMFEVGIILGRSVPRCGVGMGPKFMEPERMVEQPRLFRLRLEFGRKYSWEDGTEVRTQRARTAKEWRMT